MSYALKLYDDTLLEFNIVSTLDGFEVEITKVDEDKKSLLPLDCDCDKISIKRWLKHRVIPANLKCSSR